MSFKDVRDLSEHLKLLGYPKIFPLQALSTSYGTLASFLIVSEILQWLTELLEPGASVSGDLATEDGRVLFIHSIIEFFITKAGLKLNPRKLYAASAISAVELIKITSMLITPREQHDEESDERNYHMLNEIDMSDKMENLRLARDLSVDLTKRGASLFELLTLEMENKKVLQNDNNNKVLDMTLVEKMLKNATAAKQLKLQASHAQLENCRQELNAFTAKIQRKSAELDRTKQRLEALQKIKPTHIQEFEECEKEISKLFERYFLRIYVRDALISQLEERHKRAEILESAMTLQNSTENTQPLFSENIINFSKSVEDNLELNSESSDIRDEDILQTETNVFRPESRASILTGRRRPGSAVQRKRTSAQLTQNNQELPLNNYWKSGDNAESSFGSDSDLDMSELVDKQTDNNLITNLETQDSYGYKVDDSDLNSIDEISISKIPAELPLRPKTANKQEHQSDEDF